jgi:hypothetical protein
MQAVKTFFPDCLHIFWMVFFRPTSFRREEKALRQQNRVRHIGRAFFVIYVASVFISLSIGLLFSVFGADFNFSFSFMGVTLGVVILITLTITATVTGCLVLFFILGIVVAITNIVYSLRAGHGIHGAIEALGRPAFLWLIYFLIGQGMGSNIAFGVTFGIAICVGLGVGFGAWSGLAFSIISSVFFGIAIIIWLQVEDDINYGIERLIRIPAISLAIVGFGVNFKLTAILSVGLIGGAMGIFRIPFFFITFINTIWVLARSKRDPAMAAYFLRQSIAYWDEVALLPQPFLWRLLVAVGEQNREAGMQAITHLVTNTNQRRAAEKALLELGSRELLRCKKIDEVANRVPSSYWFSSTAASEQMKRATQAFAQCQKIAAEIGSAVASTSNYQKLTTFNRARKQLEELRQFAVLGLGRQESRNFVQIAQQWLDAVNVEIDRLGSDEAVAQEIPNPYIYPSPLLPERGAFLGRNDVFKFVEEHFLRANQNSPLVLFGQPRIGKTSVLRNLDRLPTNLIPVFVDMQEAANVQSTGGLLFNLADAIYKELAQRGQTGKQTISRGTGFNEAMFNEPLFGGTRLVEAQLKKPQLGDYTAEPFIIFRQFLDSVEKVIGAAENRLIVALDEFEEIEKKLATGVISEDLLAFLRSTMQHRTGISLIFAGTHTLNEMAGERWASYFRSAIPVRVSYLDEASARKLITNPIPDFLLDYDTEAVDLLIAETRCHPCLIQLTCSALVNLKNKHLLEDKAAGRHATVEDVLNALAEALKTGNPIFSSIWQWIPMGEQRLLALIASAGATTVAELAKKLQLSPAETRGMVVRLTEAEVLTRDEGQEKCRFQVEMFRRWVARHAIRSGIDVS